MSNSTQSTRRRRMTKEQFRKHLDLMLPPDKEHPHRYSMAVWWEHYKAENLL